MAEKLLCLCLLLALLCPSWAKKQTCVAFGSDCNECIQSGPDCAWCASHDSNIRCETTQRLQRAGCRKSDMYNPKGSMHVVKNDSRAEPVNAVFLQPQELSLHLRPGVSRSFHLAITMPTDQPITELALDASPVPAGVNITFNSVGNRNPLFVQVNVEAARCPESDDSDQMQNRTGPWSVYIKPRGLLTSVKLDISLECQCECSTRRDENSRECSGRGTLTCGRCRCYEPYYGHRCEISEDSFFAPREDSCRSGPNAPLCSGRGDCVEGACECHNLANRSERYTGQFCECSDYDCPFHDGRICGGHGMCHCGRCVCEDDWTGEDCGCSMATASCASTNQMLCSGRGMCQCGTCVCEPPFSGRTCEVCPTCAGECELNAECVECRAFGKGAEKDRCDWECSDLAVMMVETKHDLPQSAETGYFCKMHSRDDYCAFYFTFSRTASGGQAIVARARECPHN